MQGLSTIILNITEFRQELIRTGIPKQSVHRVSTTDKPGMPKQSVHRVTTITDKNWNA
jgi:hypothetical protein